MNLAVFVITKGANEVITWQESNKALSRHLSGDWGDVCKEDWEANNEALKHNQRLLSSYKTETGIKF